MKALFKIVPRFYLPAALALMAGISPLRAQQETHVLSDAQLRTALASGVPRVVIDQDITLTLDDDATVAGRQLKVPVGVSLEFTNDSKLRKGMANVEIWLNGSVPSREQHCHFFDTGIDPNTSTPNEWAPGEIRGLFGGMARRPEWWGASASPDPITDPAVLETEDDTKAINCAVGAILDTALPPSGGNGGHTVLLSSGNYYISGPIVMSNSRCILRGVPEFGTKIRAFKRINSIPGWRWEDVKGAYSWVRARQFFPPATNTGPFAFDNLVHEPNHTSMIYIGGFLVAQTGAPIHIAHRSSTDFANSVHDLVLVALPESDLQMPMSLITNLTLPGTGFLQTGAEVNTLLENIKGSNFSGYGIGFNSWALLRGVTIRNFDLGPVDPAATKAAHPIFVPSHIAAITVETGSIKSNHRGIFPKASGFNKFDTIGILSQGLVRIKDVAITDCHVGVDVMGNDGIGAVSLNGIDYDTGASLSPSPFAPFAGVVRIRHYAFENQGAGNISSLLNNITAGIAHADMPLLFEPGFTFSNGTSKIPTTANPSSTLAFYGRTHRWPNSRLGPAVTNP
ncbi:MAG TPA: hypothetical protein VG796_21315 [Verrucomicrobiales bacterium]|nr:hypothetical protein [Verrucomicrobiales bacterium]